MYTMPVMRAAAGGSAIKYREPLQLQLLEVTLKMRCRSVRSSAVETRGAE